MENTKPDVTLETSKELPTKDSPDRCPICLAPPENKAKTNACFHSFCFRCLKEWSKVKAECPLCKTPFRSIFYNIKDDAEYDQFEVPQGPQNLLQSLQQRLNASMTEFMIANSFNEFRQHVRSRQENNRSALIAATDVDTIRQRRWYYRNNNRVTHVNNKKKSRDISSKFFQRNPAQLHRLIPWLRRELIVLFGANNMYIVNRVHDLILSCIKTCGITSEEFYDEIQPYLQNQTDQFINEFLSFARSPHDISSYDQNVQYSIQSDDSVQVQRDNSHQTRAQRNPFVWNDTLLPIDPPLTDAGRPKHLRKKRRIFHHSKRDQKKRLSISQEVIEISSSEASLCDDTAEKANSDSSNDVTFVKFEKPPSERTPDAYITISSNDDETPGPSGLSSHNRNTISSSSHSSSSEFEPTVRSVIIPVGKTSNQPDGKLCKVKAHKQASCDPFSSRSRLPSSSDSSSCDNNDNDYVFRNRHRRKQHRSRTKNN